MTDTPTGNPPHILVETWQPNERWFTLDAQAQRQFLEDIGAAANAARDGGMQILGWGALERSVSNPVAHGFCGVFLVDSVAALHAVDAAIRAAGWYDYFDHANVAARLSGRDGVNAGAVLCDLLGVTT